MKNTLIRKIIFYVCGLLTVVQFHSHANAGQNGNGGDYCEDQIKIIRDDISEWIKKGGAGALNLPSGLSLSDYIEEMTNAISSVSISCGDEEIEVDGIPKTCKNFRDDFGRSQIACNANRFKNTDDDGRYILIHHELAGIAGFEVTDPIDGSVYPLSNQLAAFLELRVTKRLVVKPAKPSKPKYRYQRVKDLFESMTIPASVFDFPKIEVLRDDSATQECWMFNSNDRQRPAHVYWMHIDGYSYGGSGPLFPPTRISARDGLVFAEEIMWNSFGPDGPNGLENVRDFGRKYFSEVQSTSSDLLAILPSARYRHWGDTPSSDAPIQLELRKNENYIGFRLTCQKSVEFGYCLPTRFKNRRK